MARIPLIASFLTRSRAPQPAPDRDHIEQVRLFDAAKDEFVSLVSQELRTPLTSVRGYLDLVLDGTAGELTADQKRFLAVAARSCERLHRLVDDLLVIAHAGAGRLSLQWDRVDLVEVARDAVERIRPAAGERGIDLVLTTCGVAPLLADRSQIAQLAEALLESTLAPTPPGGRVTLGVRLHGGQASIDVSAPAGELGIPGSGLSLSVARAIAEAHGGTLELRSGPRTTDITATVPTHVPAEFELHEEAA